MNAIVLFEFEPLNPLEYGILQECESVIGKGLATFIDVGTALIEIRDQRLYRAQYGTFEEYCHERWSMNRNYANKLISASEVVANLGTRVPILPDNERQARPLAKLEPEQQRTAWEAAVASAETMQEAVTAAIVAAAVEVIKDKPEAADATTQDLLNTDDNELVQAVIQEYTAQKNKPKSTPRKKRLRLVIPIEAPLITDDSWRGPTSEAEDHAIWLWARMKDFERDGHMDPGAQVIYNHLQEHQKQDMARLIKPILKFMHELEVLL